MKIQKILINALITIIVFVVGFLVSATLFTKPASDSQFEIYEQVAYDAYTNQGDQNIIEVPDGICVKRTATAITVTRDGSRIGQMGKVVAKIKDGKLVTIRDLETARAITTNIGLGIVFALIYILIFLSKYYEK